MELTQRHLVNRRIRFKDGELVTKYVFPFWDRGWDIPFHLVDRLGRPPAILAPPVTLEPDGRLRTPTEIRNLRGVDAFAPQDFRERFHFDPWWVFRGMGGVSEEMKRVILPTNIAGSFALQGRRWKVHDVDLEPGGARVLAIIAKDDVFRARTFTKADFDLDLLVARP